MLSKRKPGPVRRRLRKYTAILLMIVIILVIFFETSVKGQLTSLIVEELKRVNETAVIDAVDAMLQEDQDLCDGLIELHTSGGSVQAISTDPAAINRVKTAISKAAQQNIDSACSENGVTVSLGGLTGLVILAETGPKIRLNVDSAQTVRCEFKSSFESAGVNQTIHHITLTAYTDMTVSSPYRIDDIKCRSSFEIAQTVIVGSVPSYTGVVTY